MNKYYIYGIIINDNGKFQVKFPVRNFNFITEVNYEYCTHSPRCKKELLVQFCIAYCGIMSRHSLCATGTTGKLVHEATGLNINCFLSGSQGGGQQIASRIACNEIDLLIFFRDPLNPKPHEPNDNDLLRLCDVHNIPFATNIATAEALVRGVERGDFEWREIVNPRYNS